MANVSIILEKSDPSIGPMTVKRVARRKMAKDVKRSYTEYSDSWIYRFQPPDTMVVTGDIDDFDEAFIP